MTHIVHCLKLKKDLEGLANPPFKNELGNRIYDNISQQAWSMWLSHQTMIINEYRLNLMDGEARAFIITQLKTFLFDE